MPVLELLSSSGLGSLLGVRHAFEPDHLAAVSTLVTRERDWRRAAFLGVCWGLGHTLSLVVVGGALILLSTGLSPAASAFFEFLVALMLIVLGSRAILQSVRQGPSGPTRLHHHGRLAHAHPGASSHVHVGPWTLASRPLLVGAVHGLAGSGALTALVLVALPTTAGRLAYMTLFGLGSTVGMAILSGLLGWPMARLGSHRTIARAISLTVGCISIGLGFTWGYPFVAQLLWF